MHLISLCARFTLCCCCLYINLMAFIADLSRIRSVNSNVAMSKDCSCDVYKKMTKTYSDMRC